MMVTVDPVSRIKKLSLSHPLFVFFKISGMIEKHKSPKDGVWSKPSSLSSFSINVITKSVGFFDGVDLDSFFVRELMTLGEDVLSLEVDEYDLTGASLDALGQLGSFV